VWQADNHCTEDSTSSIYVDQLSNSVITTPPGLPVSRQCLSTCGRLGTNVQPPGQRVKPGSTGSNAFCDMIGYLPATSDGGNSRDSWSSTSSNAVVCQSSPADQQWWTYHCPPQQPTQYSRHMYQQQQYDWARRHTWAQVETNQSRCHQVYPQHRQQPNLLSFPTLLRFQCVNPRPQSHQAIQHQYQRSTSSIHPHHLAHHGVTHLPSACFPGMTHVQQVNTTQSNLPAQQQRSEYGMPGSEWVKMEDQCVTTSSGLPVKSYTQLNTAPQTSVAWYLVDDPAGTTTLAEPNKQQQQQQHADLLIHNSSSVSLSSNLSFPWSPDASCDNRLNDWWQYRQNDRFWAVTSETT